MGIKSTILSSLFFLCLVSSHTPNLVDSTCSHKDHLLCSLEVGPVLENPPKKYSRFHDRDKFGYKTSILDRQNACLTADIDVEYGPGFTADAKNAFQFAIEIWERCVVSDVRIRVDATFEPAGLSNLGSANMITIQRDFNDAPFENTFYPVAIANSLADKDLDNSRLDIEANFNSNRSDWYFGIDGNCPNDKYDFVTVVLHELCHGLGFSGSAIAGITPNSASIGYLGLPFVYDLFVEDINGTPVINYPSGSSSLFLALVTNLFYVGPGTSSAHGNNPVKLYSPNPYKPGSSYSHFDEISFAGELMTPFLSAGEVIHDPGDLTIGLFEDNGWEVNRPCFTGALYVDRTHVGTESGTNANPYNTLKEAVNAADQGNYILFKSSNTHGNSVPILITKRLQFRLTSDNNGPVIIQ